MKALFVIPFTTGVVFLFSALAVLYISWFRKIGWKNQVRMKNAVSWRWFIRSLKEVFSESLLHLRIRKVNLRLWYMHMSLATGWFLLIVVGHAESAYHSGTIFTPMSHATFLDYYSRGETPDGWIAEAFNHLMDLLLLFVLSGLMLAVIKRFRARRLGMKKKPRHQTLDRLALIFLWLIFPARLLAESLNHAFYGGGGFLSSALGGLIHPDPGYRFLSDAAWWVYSLSLGAFFVVLPFSRYMHILTEVPHIFLKNAGTRVIADEGIAMFHAHACSSCGICLNTCQLNDAGKAMGQSLNFVRNYRKPWPVKEEQTMNCLMCGRCRIRCPVQVDTAGLRMNERFRHHSGMLHEYSYLEDKRVRVRPARVAYFGGCMTRLTPSIPQAMKKIFMASGEDFAWVDEKESICCGRPLYLSGQLDAFHELIRHTRDRILECGPELIVVSCPICLHTFSQDYPFRIPVKHHSQYLLELMDRQVIRPVRTGIRTVYHDSCELGRGLGIYSEPRRVLEQITHLQNPDFRDGDGMCCGGSLAELELGFPEIQLIARKTIKDLTSPDTQQLVTGCPLCKKTFHAAGLLPVLDISEAVAAALVSVPAEAERSLSSCAVS
jgi:Fe-S oxidoreductase